MTLALPFPIERWDETDPFGNWPQWRKELGYGAHRGDDWAPGAGVAIPASGAGRVVAISFQSALGWFITVEYDDVPDVYFSYCHLQERPGLTVGDRVALGATIGHVGNTGSASLGAHLHLVASRDPGNPAYVVVINPMQFFSASDTAGGNITPIIPQEESMAQGAFYRVESGQNKGTIYWQSEPNEPLLPLDEVQWDTYAANGNKFKDFTSGQLEPLMRRCGVIELDKLGRIKRDAGGKPSVWLPGAPA